MRPFIILILFLFLAPSIFAQNTIKIKNGNLKIVNDAVLLLKDCQLQNNANLTAANGMVEMKGTGTNTQSEIGGTGNYSFHNLKINKSSNHVQLGTNITVNNEIEMASGNLDLLSNTLILGLNGFIKGESENTRITSTSTGEILKIVDLNAPTALNPGNIGLSITSARNLGLSIIQRGHDHQTIPSGTSIFRHFTVSPDNNMGLDATLTFHYFDAELNGKQESSLVLLENNNGWLIDGFESRDATANTVTFSGYDALFQYTLGSTFDDADMDGISADMDNCPNTSNPDQVDADNDLVGDVCDNCPNGDDAVDANSNSIIDDCECKEEEMEVAGIMTADSTYVAGNTIASTETIAVDYTAVYKAGESITLTAGFHVEAGASFLATIATCEYEIMMLQLPNTSQTKVSSSPRATPTLAVSPNPFLNNTTINYTIPKNSKVTLVIQDVNGQQLAVLLDKVEMNKGQYELDWSAVNLPAGIYFLAMDDGMQKLTQKLVLVSQ